MFFFFFFFNDTATTEIYTLSLHDALPIFSSSRRISARCSISSMGEPKPLGLGAGLAWPAPFICAERSEEHTSELQSRQYLVCRLLLEKKKKYNTNILISKRKLLRH